MHLVQNGLRKTPPRRAELASHQSANSQVEGKPLLYQNGISESEVSLRNPAIAISIMSKCVTVDHIPGRDFYINCHPV